MGEFLWNWTYHSVFWSKKNKNAKVFATFWPSKCFFLNSRCHRNEQQKKKLISIIVQANRDRYFLKTKKKVFFMSLFRCHFYIRGGCLKNPKIMTLHNAPKICKFRFRKNSARNFVLHYYVESWSTRRNILCSITVQKTVPLDRKFCASLKCGKFNCYAETIILYYC